jgi:hypothetical protein
MNQKGVEDRCWVVNSAASAPFDVTDLTVQPRKMLLSKYLTSVISIKLQIS